MEKKKKNVCILQYLNEEKHKLVHKINILVVVWFTIGFLAGYFVEVDLA
jgi:hypothetical protein